MVKLFYWIATIIGFISCVNHSVMDFEKFGDTPYKGNGYKPQGLSFLTDSTFLLSVHHKDELSTVHEVDKNTTTSKREFKMPSTASHTSGLSVYEGQLYACDYNDKRIYLIDIEKSFTTGEAHVIKYFDTPLGGTSAMEMFKHKGKEYMAISDFMNSRKTYVLDYGILDSSQSFDEAIVVSYSNGYFSQGLMYHSGKLIETTNSLFRGAFVEIRDIDSVLNGSNNVEKIDVPMKAIEDIDINNGVFWTTDEKTFEYVTFKLDDE